ncbi:hypothetical protein EDC91_11379 [Shewanella fodinae]|uniref:Uncharacterized protein n=1 Tax=Shewanella fodinae TaxID=552357 RepID=A0A4R2FA08_9GAMM|nr:hypothetical protein EDC91_11379 [Shewanella fodinae]
MPGLVGESGGFGFVQQDLLRFRASVLEGGVTWHVGHQMLAGSLELVADQAEVEQEDPEVVFGALGIEIPLAAGGGPSIERLGGDRKAELQVGLDPPRVEGRLEPAELYRAPVPDVVQVDPVVAAVVVVLGLAVVVAVPDAVELVLGAGAMLFDALDQFVTDRPGVAVEPVAADAEGVENQRLLLVDDLGQVTQVPAVEGRGVDMDVDAALAVDLAPGAADGPDHLLQLRDVVVAEHRADHLGPQMGRDAGQGGVPHHLPDAAAQVLDLPGVIAAGDSDMADCAAHHRVDGPGDLFPGAFYGLDLDPVVDLFQVHACLRRS